MRAPGQDAATSPGHGQWAYGGGPTDDRDLAWSSDRYVASTPSVWELSSSVIELQR
jgi:hypothetical protein